MKILLYSSCTLLLIYLLICTYLYWQQDKFIFFPTKLPQDHQFPFHRFEEVYLNNGNARLHALHFQLDHPKGIVLYFHGNAGALEKWGYQAQPFRELGYEVVMPDYRTYGKSTGQLSESALIQDAQLWYNYAREHFPASSIILYGRSLGSGIACHLASLQEARLLVLETPYRSIPDVAAKVIPGIIPVRQLLKFRFENYQYIQHLKCPVHIFHGTADTLIPYAQALQLAEVYGDQKILTTIPGGGHNNLPSSPIYQAKLSSLLL